MKVAVIEVPGTSFEYNGSIKDRLVQVGERVDQMRAAGQLSGEVLRRIQDFFRIRNIYNSNAIEGNLLDIGETRLVVEQGLTLTGKSLKDQTEAKNLSQALDYLEELATKLDRPIGETDIRQIHRLILTGIDDDNAGQYRTLSVTITGSSISPPSAEMVPSQMGDFTQWFRQRSAPGPAPSGEHPITLAAAAHAWFVQIHPFVDGNGRAARILMNLLLMRYSYPIAIITREDRQRYYDALEDSQGSDLTPLIGLIAEAVEESLEEWEKAAEEKREMDEWTSSVAKRLTQPQRVEKENRYEVWKSAMELLKSVVREAVEGVNKNSMRMAKVFLRDYGIIEFEKYLTLSQRISAKRTWFFRIDMVSEFRSARYLFFFGYPSSSLRGRVDVTLHIAREEPEKSYNYVELATIGGASVPNLVEVGYLAEKEKLLTRGIDGPLRESSIHVMVREFFESVAELFSQGA